MSIGLAGVEVYIEEGAGGGVGTGGRDDERAEIGERRGRATERKLWDEDGEVRRKERKSATKSTRGRKGSSNSNLDVAG